MSTRGGGGGCGRGKLLKKYGVLNWLMKPHGQTFVLKIVRIKVNYTGFGKVRLS